MRTKLGLLICSLALALFMTGAVKAQQIMSNDGLLSGAKSANQNRDWVTAYGLLMAYIQRDPPEMANAQYRDQTFRILDGLFRNARSSSIAGGGEAGYEGKGDSAASGRPVPFDLPTTKGHPQAYRLECRGGGQMTANYYPSGETVALEIHFDKAQQAARAASPQPGECTWVDRPIGSSEPYWLKWSFARRSQGIDRITFGSNSGIPDIGLGPSSGEYVLGAIMEIDGNQLDRVIHAIHGGGRFAVECYNDGRGRFVVTQVYPPR
jgi:hypothetical protein